MNGNENNPVTEAEMRAFFTRLVDTIVAGSKTQGELTTLQGRFDELNQRVSSLIGDNEKLRQEIYSTSAKLSHAERGRDENKALAESYVQDLTAARDRNGILVNDLWRTKDELEKARKRIKTLQDAFNTVFNEDKVQELPGKAPAFTADPGPQPSNDMPLVNERIDHQDEKPFEEDHRPYWEREVGRDR